MCIHSPTFPLSFFSFVKNYIKILINYPQYPLRSSFSLSLSLSLSLFVCIQAHKCGISSSASRIFTSTNCRTTSKSIYSAISVISKVVTCFLLYIVRSACIQRLSLLNTELVLCSDEKPLTVL